MKNPPQADAPRPGKRRAWGILAVRGLLVCVFLAASLPKLADPAGFALQLFRYRLLPDVLVNPAALLLPWLEFWTAVCLLCWPRARRTSAGLLVLLSGLFIVAEACMLITGRHIPCGCFSTRPDASVITGWNVAREALLAALALLAWRQEAPPCPTRSAADRRIRTCCGSP